MKTRMPGGYRTIIGICMVIVIIASISGYVLTYPDKLGVCLFDLMGNCLTPYAETVGRPLLIGTTPLIGILLFLWVLPARLFYRWILFSSLYIPVSVMIILVADPYGGAYSYNIDTQFMTWLVTSFFVLISFGMIIFHVITKKRL